MTNESRKAEVVARIEELHKEIKAFDISEHFSENDYCEFLTEVYGSVDICGMSYAAGDALQQIDETAFRCGYNDWLDTSDNEECDEYNDLVSELEELENELDELEEAEEDE